MNLRSWGEKKKRVPRIVSNTINDGVGVAGGCGEGVVGVNGFSSPGSSAAADFLSFLCRFFDFRLRLGVGVGGGGVESGLRGVWGTKSDVIVVGRKK